MQTKVADSVRAQTRRAVADKLTRLVDSLVDALEVAEQQSGMTLDQMRAAALWSGALATIAADVAHDARYSQPLVEAVGRNMDQLLEGWGMPPGRNPSADHSNLARVLARSGADEAGVQTKQVAADVRRVLEDENSRRPAPDASGLETPLGHWDRVDEEFLQPGRAAGRVEFRLLIFGGIESDPSPFEGNERQSLPAGEYVDVMRRKIRRVSQTYGTRLVEEIRGHLGRLADRYRAVGSEGDRVDPGAKAQYAEFRARLATLR
jgi:hypothetical protein